MPLPVQTTLLRRLLFGASLFGLLVVAHLALQKASGFANGCSGVAGVIGAGDLTGETAGCQTVTESIYADFLGVSNIVWGLLFYALMAALRLGYVAFQSDTLRKAAFGLASVGLLYTAYLVYLQVAEIGAFCVLCMTSAATVLALFGLHLAEHRRLAAAAPVEDSARRRGQPAPAPWWKAHAAIAAAFAVLLVADVSVSQRAAAEVRADPARSFGEITAEARARAAAEQGEGACDYKPGVEPIADLTRFTSAPFLGPEDAPVVAIEVFDPNCPHCKTLADTIDPLAEARGDVKVHYVPYPLRPNSVGQVVALKLAAREGKYIDLIQEMFRRQDATWGMSLDELLATVEAVGMDPGAVRRTLEDQATLQPILNQIQLDATAVEQAFADPDGGMSTPRLAVGDRVVSGTTASFSNRCLNEYFDAAGS